MYAMQSNSMHGHKFNRQFTDPLPSGYGAQARVYVAEGPQFGQDKNSLSFFLLLFKTVHEMKREKTDKMPILFDLIANLFIHISFICIISVNHFLYHCNVFIFDV